MGLSPVTQDIVSTFIDEYKKTPDKLKIIDLFLLFQFCTGAIQCIYVAVVGTFPFNAFLAGILSCVGSFVLTVSLRMICNGENKDFKDVAHERAFADYVIGMLLLHLVVATFIG